MATRIVFSDSVSVTVTADVQEVRDKLDEAKHGVGNAFAQFEQHGAGFEAQRPGYVFVAADRVAYIEEVRGSR
jgi:hypothetical protein